MKSNGIDVHDGWHLTPEGAAIHLAEQTAVVADLHLGYEWARGAAGDCVITHSLDETLARLELLLSHAKGGASDRRRRSGRITATLSTYK